MWSDNETSKDLLGFQPYAEVAADILRNPDMLPLTVGIFGDWGSGKSSLMNLIEDAVKADDVVIVKFQPWLHKDYDDVKGALMVSILDALEARRGKLAHVKDETVVAASAAFRGIAKRIDWLRVVGFLGKTGAGALMTAAGHPMGMLSIIGGVGDLSKSLTAKGADSDKATTTDGGFLKAESPSVDLRLQNDEPIERGISSFRSEFADLLDKLKLTSLIVLVDDIDRCLPPTIVDVLEAIRLFFAVPKTAFVIGADERIIRHALATKYPESPELATDLGREYLEKIIQIPLNVPKLSVGEVQAYMHLLVLQLHLENAEPTLFKQLQEKAAENRSKRDLASAMNYGIAQPFIEKGHPDLVADLTAISEIAPVLAQLINGKPREVKRFLNTLYIRRALAVKSGLTVKFDVLAKMTVLEYFDTDVYRRLHSLSQATGIVEQVADLEAALVPGGSGDFPEELAPFVQRPRVRRWFLSGPSLSGIDLTPYFTIGRERLDWSSGTQRLPEHLQRLVRDLTDQSEAVRGRAHDNAKGLDVAELALLFDALGKLVRQRPLEESLISLVDLASLQPGLKDELAGILRDLPVISIPFSLPARIQRIVFAAAIPSGSLAQVIERWIGQSDNPKLRVAATKSMRPVSSLSGKKT